MEDIEILTCEGRFSATAAGSSDAPSVVLLHGFPQSRRTWQRVLPALADHGFRAIAPDQRGYSPGVRPQAVHAYTLDRLVEDVLDLMDALGLEQAHLVGHDWGGQVAWATAAYHPHRVTSLCALSRPHPSAFAHALDVDPEQTARSGHHSAFQEREATDLLWRDDCAALRAGFEHEGVPEEDIAAYLGVFSDRTALDAALNWYRAEPHRGLSIADFPAVFVPTTYIWGERDSTVGRIAAELTAEYVRGPYRFVEVAGSGHFLTDDGGVQTVVRELLAHVTTFPEDRPASSS